MNERHSGWQAENQPISVAPYVYRGQSQHVHAIELRARAAAETPRSADLGETADGGPSTPSWNPETT